MNRSDHGGSEAFVAVERNSKIEFDSRIDLTVGNPAQILDL